MLNAISSWNSICFHSMEPKRGDLIKCYILDGVKALQKRKKMNV